MMDHISAQVQAERDKYESMLTRVLWLIDHAGTTTAEFAETRQEIRDLIRETLHYDD